MDQLINDLAFYTMCAIIISPVWLWLGRVFFDKVCEWRNCCGEPTIAVQAIMPVLFPFLLVLRTIKTLWRLV